MANHCFKVFYCTCKYNNYPFIPKRYITTTGTTTPKLRIVLAVKIIFCLVLTTHKLPHAYTQNTIKNVTRENCKKTLYRQIYPQPKNKP